jgi:hypothetical protein
MIGLRSTLPAVLMAMSIPPKRFFAAANAPMTSAIFVKLPWTANASPPVALMSPTVLSASALVDAPL